MIVEQKDWDDLSNYRDSLEHFNVKGSSWYQHKRGRWQKHAKYAHGMDDPNKDNSKATKSDSSKKKTFRERQEETAKQKAKDKDAKEKAKAEKKASEAKAKAEKDAAKKEKERKDILKNPTKLYKHRDEFTYDEIKEAIKRFDWEKQLYNHSKERLKQGSDYIQSALDYTNKAINLYNAAARIVNSVSGDGETNTIPFIGKQDETKNKRVKKKDDKKKPENS